MTTAAAVADYLLWASIAEPVDEPALPEEVKEFLNEILDVFGVETAIALELTTHHEQPWADTIWNASLLAAPALYCWSIQSFGARHAHQ